MQPLDASLRDDLAALADEAGPLRVTSEHIAGKARRRRRWMLGSSTAATALVVLVASASAWLGGRSDGGVYADAEPSASRVGRPFVCGEELVLGADSAASRAGLTMALTKVRKVADDVGPELAVTFTGDQPMQVRGSPRTLFEVLYLRDGVIVGGGPMLNEAGDSAPQGLNLVGGGFDVAPGQPFTDDLGRRDRLCAGLRWPEVWSQYQRYEAVLVQGQVSEINGRSDLLRLDIPTLGRGPLLVARTSLDG